MGHYALVAIGYNRPKSMQRLLNSLAAAEYGADDVTLIISIDNSGDDSVEKCANTFEWIHGEKKVVTYPKRQGLRKHILHCGDFVKDYDAIAVFEDDVVASVGFYQYMKQAVEFYKNDDRIAGISLYTHLWNVNVNLPFQPAYGATDVFFMQFAQSWGQVWMRKQWLEFAEWYKDNSEEFGDDDEIPAFVTSWGKNSWLKYHIKYCVKMNKHFVYPYASLSTCFTDVGEHCDEKKTLMQVPLLEETIKEYRFCLLNDKAIKYDAFFEREGLCRLLNLDHPLTVDIYGSKKESCFRRYLLSTKDYNFKVLRKFSLDMRPQELNVVNNIDGEDIYLYDTSFEEVNKKRKNFDTNMVSYYFKLCDHREALFRWFIKKIKQRIIRS